MTLCLAVNTANTVLSVAVVRGQETLFSYATGETRNQGNLLLEHARRGLDECGIGWADLDLLAVVTGPGSFTGIRIGIAAMRGIALAAKLPLIGIDSFDLYAEDGKNIVALESWRDELYFRVTGQPPVNCTVEDLAAGLDAGEPYVISGDAAQKLSPLLPQSRVVTDLPDATRVAHLAIARFESGGAQTEKPVPFYLRPADVTLSSKNRKTEGA